MSTRPKLSPQLQPVTHAAAVVVRRNDRAHVRAARAAGRTPSRALARHWGVSESRARHLRTDDAKGPLTKLLGMIADPEIEAAPIVVAVLAAFEDRYTHAPRAELRARLEYLRGDAEHMAEARQNRALQTETHEDVGAVLDHASVLIEIAVLEDLLTPGEERAH